MHIDFNKQPELQWNGLLQRSKNFEVKVFTFHLCQSPDINEVQVHSASPSSLIELLMLKKKNMCDTP